MALGYVFVNQQTLINNGNKTFYVDKDGNMIANSGNFKGTISASEISGSQIIGTSINNGNGTFSVDEKGKVSASSMTITGGSISIQNNNDTAFSVDENGKLYAKNAEIEGKISTDNITATNGEKILNGRENKLLMTICQEFPEIK